MILNAKMLLCKIVISFYVDILPCKTEKTTQISKHSQFCNKHSQKQYMVIRNNCEGEKNVLSGRCAYSTSLHYKEGDTITHRPQVHQI